MTLIYKMNKWYLYDLQIKPVKGPLLQPLLTSKYNEHGDLNESDDEHIKEEKIK